MARTKSINDTASKAIKNSDKGGFSLDKYKKSKGLTSSAKFKKQRYIEFSPAVKGALSLTGIPMGHVVLARGGSDTGKTSLLIEAAVEAQKMGVLPVFIITEMKWDFAHAQQMGLDVVTSYDEENNMVNYEGFFIYADRSSLNTIEDVAAFMIDKMNDQKRGDLPYDLLFLWDSIGSVPCEQSVKSGNNNPMWNAGAMATQFGNFINQQIPLTRKESYPYTNTFFAINKTGVQPALTPMSQPKMTNKGGNAMFFDSTMVITFGNVTNSGTTKIKAVKNGKNVEFAKRTKIAVDKLHTDDGVVTASTIIVTPHGFIPDTDVAIKEYKKLHAHEWFSDIKDIDDLIIEEDASEWMESREITGMVDVEINTDTND